MFVTDVAERRLMPGRRKKCLQISKKKGGGVKNWDRLFKHAKKKKKNTKKRLYKSPTSIRKKMLRLFSNKRNTN